jgi:aryl-alcohol dehydrogenase-like predicted oxidoreductase
MQQRPFGNTGLSFSEIGLGCWQLGGSWGEVSDSTALQILERAVAGGINFFDTADVYGDGRSERIIGDFLSQNQSSVFVATKIGRSGIYPDNYTRDTLKTAITGNLNRLRKDRLDLVQLHCIPTAVLRKGEVFDWLREFQEEGLIHHFGASVETMEEALLCMEQEGLVSLQIIFNLLRQKPRDVLFPKARERGTALIVRLPLASGLLAGTMTRETTFGETDHRNFNRDGAAFNVGETFSGLPFERGVELVDAARRLLPAGLPLAVAAQRWILDHPEVSVVITGASKPTQVRENARASSTAPLSEQTHAALREFYAREVHPHIRGPY